MTVLTKWRLFHIHTATSKFHDRGTQLPDSTTRWPRGNGARSVDHHSDGYYDPPRPLVTLILLCRVFRLGKLNPKHRLCRSTACPDQRTRRLRSQVAKATDCKSVIVGSTPTGAS